MSKRLKIIFAISLILNALLGGYLAGHMIRYSHSPRTPHEFRTIGKDMRGPIASERRNLFVIMAANPFDVARFNAQLDVLTKMQYDFNRQYFLDLNNRLQQMSPDQRTDAIKKMTRPGPRAHSRRGPRGPEHRHGPRN